MKRSYYGVLCLCFVLLLNIFFTQKAIHAFYYQNYDATIIFAILNLVLFPAAVIIYQREKKV
ncbi:hypothetical protein [Longirhabdus pacifica]|uniref:hypothetical protein n=1 Tax=Longirhabdus pacifica TaxID=2305227 RepID=UPI0010087BFC|nr:hypothetical protein [Longirhabdus pacifica]